MAALSDGMQQGMPDRVRQPAHRHGIIGRINREDPLDFRDLAERLALLRTADSQRNPNAITFQQCQRQRHTGRRKVTHDRGDCSFGDRLLIEKHVVSRPLLREPAVGHKALAEDQRRAVAERLKALRQKVRHHTPPR